MATGLKLVINLFSLVGTFNGSAALVSEFPLLRASNGFWKQTKIVCTMRMVGATVQLRNKSQIFVHNNNVGTIVGTRLLKNNKKSP